MSENAIVKAMEERNRLIEESSREIVKRRAEELERFAVELLNEFETKRGEISSEIAKIEAGGRNGL